MCKASGVILDQLFLAVQNSSFCCLIVQTSVSYHAILMYHLNYEHTGLYCKVLPSTALSRYFPTTANEPDVSHMHRQQLTSVLKNKVDKSTA